MEIKRIGGRFDLTGVIRSIKVVVVMVALMLIPLILRDWTDTTVYTQTQAPAAEKASADPNLKRWKDEENREFASLVNEEQVYQAKLEAVQARRQAWVLLMRDRYGCNTAEWDAISDEKGGAFRKKVKNAKGDGR